jgi:hypothetical protein
MGAVDLKGWFSMTRSMERGSGGIISLPYSSFKPLNMGIKRPRMFMAAKNCRVV